MKSEDQTLLLRRSEVDQLLGLEECIDAVEEAFRLQGEGKIPATGLLGVKGMGGGLHVKSGMLPGPRNFIVAKLNTNFPGNQDRFGLPTIQGLIVLCDAENGRLLAVLDSIDITIKRTAAASAVAAKYLARANSTVATVCGCGQQGREQLRALRIVLPLAKVYAFDLNREASETFAVELRTELRLGIEPIQDLRRAISDSQVCVTCTTADKFFISKQDVTPGTFIAAVGADDAHKQEIDPTLMAGAKVVADSLEQCCTIGDTHHPIALGLMRREDVYGELSEIVCRRKPGRQAEDEIIVFDSTGVAIEDAVTAAMVYEKARDRGVGSYFDFKA